MPRDDDGVFKSEHDGSYHYQITLRCPTCKTLSGAFAQFKEPLKDPDAEIPRECTQCQVKRLGMCSHKKCGFAVSERSDEGLCLKHHLFKQRKDNEKR